MKGARSRAAFAAHRAKLIEMPPAQRAAVAMLLRQSARGEEMLFIQRAASKQDPWSGQIALPGGGFESRDGDLLQTAMRETREEVGLEVAADELLVRLDDQHGRAGLRHIPLAISCFVFDLSRARDDAALRLNYEVAEAFWSPLDVLLDARRRFVYETPLRPGGVPAVNLDAECEAPAPVRVLWGLTYRFVMQFLAMARGA